MNEHQNNRQNNLTELSSMIAPILSRMNKPEDKNISLNQLLAYAKINVVVESHDKLYYDIFYKLKEHILSDLGEA
jgi:hypothetical protein